MTTLDVTNTKILDLKTLENRLAMWRLFKKKIVFTNGCFDILHRGHLEYLSQARDRGDLLIIGVNSDASVKRIKGEGRPVQDETSRALTLASLRFVEAIILFDEDTPYELIKIVKPDVLVKGGDYNENTIVGADIVRANGGDVVVIPLVQGYSTTEILKKV
jgi:D-glycero-beta-D-manno-heptose 1-phosphate adenylyltransferase